MLNPVLKLLWYPRVLEALPFNGHYSVLGCRGLWCRGPPGMSIESYFVLVIIFSVERWFGDIPNCSLSSKKRLLHFAETLWTWVKQTRCPISNQENFAVFSPVRGTLNGIQEILETHLIHRQYKDIKWQNVLHTNTILHQGTLTFIV